MNRHARRAASKSRRRAIPSPDQHWHAQTIDAVIADLYVNTLHCRYGRCRALAVRWYLRTDLEDRRLVMYPACALHCELVEAEVCGPGCLAPKEQHYVSDHEDLLPQVTAALQVAYGLAWPMRGDADRLDVIRPRP